MDINFSKELFSESFLPLLENKDRYILLYGGRDSGKSHFAAQKLVIECLRQSYFRCIIVKKTYESIKDSQYQTIKDLIYDWNLDHLFKFTTSPIEISCINGNKFIARGCDKPEKLKSIKDPSHVWYEEGNHLSYEDFITITSTVRSTNAEYLQEIFSFNPEHDGELDKFWVYTHFFKGKTDKTFSDAIELEIDNEKVSMPYTIHHSTYKDNAYCTGERKIILEGLKNTNPYYYNVFTLGNWGVKEIQSPYITTFEEVKHVSSDAVFDKSKQFVISFDFNIGNTAATFYHYGTNYIHLFDEIVANDLPEMLDKIKMKYKGHLHKCEITGDRSGNNRTHLIGDSMNSYRLIKNTLGLSNNQFKIIVNPTHKENRATCNFLLSLHPNFIINPNCTRLIYDLKYVECDDNQQIIKKDRNVANQKADFLDSFRYFLNVYKRKWIKDYNPQS